MRHVFLTVGAVLVGATLGLCQVPVSKPTAGFEHQLIDRQRQLLQASHDNNSTFVDRVVANDFRGIGTNGDFYDKHELVDSAQDGLTKDTRAYDFQVIKLNDACAVVAYNLIVPGEHPRYRHMSDTWAKVESGWKLKFRQTTPNTWSENDAD
jgi:hypothetical protein